MVAMLATLARPVASQVKIWRGSRTLPSYGEALPGPNPPFDIYQINRFNDPFTLRTNLAGAKAGYAWRAIYLENENL
jgi:hypothetical protein